MQVCTYNNCLNSFQNLRVSMKNSFGVSYAKEIKGYSLKSSDEVISPRNLSSVECPPPSSITVDHIALQHYDALDQSSSLVGR